jgi:CheY-like chemotaxis protein
MQTASAALPCKTVAAVAALPAPLLLVVEGDDAVRARSVAALAQAGYRTIEARTGFEALVKACWHEPALIMIGLPLGSPEGVGSGDTVELLSACPATTEMRVLTLEDRAAMVDQVRRLLS